MVEGRRALKQMGAVWELRPQRPVKAGGGPRPGRAPNKNCKTLKDGKEGLPRALGPPPVTWLLAWLLSGGQWCVSPHLHAQSE